MSNSKLDRRLFMKGAGAATFMAGAASLPTTAASARGMGHMSMSMAYDLNEEFNRIGSGDFKWDAIRKGARPYEVPYPMGVADMDFRTLPHITAALQKRLNHHNWGYEAPPADYKENIVKWNKKRYDQDVDPSTIKNCIGVLDGVSSALRTVCEPGDKVILHTPNYSSFFGVIPNALCELAESDLIYKDGVYDFDYDDTERLLKEGAKVIILCNPQNPTGNCWTADQLRKLGDLANQYNALMIADEIHCDFVNKHAKYVPYASLGDAYAMNSITLKSTSKSFNLAAHRTGYMFSDNKELLDRIQKIGNHQRALLNTMGTIASNAAYKHGETYMDDMQAYMDANAHFLEKFCAEKLPLIDYKVHEGTYLAWLDCSKLAEKLGSPEGDDRVGDMMKKFFIQKAGVNINPGENYGRTGVGFMRMNLGTTHKKLHGALMAIEKACNAL
ncbi:MalY/PatB family protein [Pseudemcibacter aquimaris]|uniref:MalY/PatB family protein n=1 Tax=Pseudemcibacter aquimaris TaxID=2857064 RepID=UPI00201235FF|nr:aminotransferase class I/II-fold pyridoxal phosphate-dependent enzyme [Pseudemcibacter aquimaris]MCC3861030.1 aminotransferase class I/II-fold pyridoxal phosphate-dependent enzyme [Pseudemcibacter aquimaris]WDU59848.1 aminotransferase class I/II-fold pyridoxal phosphate-dependent enzyme [Pseudemcibacter aquimaris]